MQEEKNLKISAADLLEFSEQAKDFTRLMTEYRCALREVETKLQVLNEEFTFVHNRNPFETIKTRLKSPKSIVEKMRKKGLEMTVENLESNIFDVAGIRVICSFQDDIYQLEKLLLGQDDIRLRERKDYIAHPKPNGYRSLHLIVEIPIFLSSGKKWKQVEIQFRTIAMDFWASLEHKLRYKKTIEHQEEIVKELTICSEAINKIDNKMLEIRYMIEETSGTDRRYD